MDLELTQGINSALPIGIQHFDGAPVGQELAQVIEQDLRFSGQFKFINPYGSAESLAQWKQAGADSVLTAAVREQAYGHYSISYKLFDAASNGRLLLAKEYQFNRGELRDLAHHVADEIYQKLTGERGVFSTKIAYVLVQRQGGQERHSLEIADMDGRNPRSLLVSSEPIMSPTWSPDGRELAYVSFEKKRTQIYTVSLETGQRRLLTDFPGINGAPAWSPDGRHLAVVLSKGGSPKIYTVDLSNGEMKQLTFGSAIDTEPRYAPDGQSLLFTSGRGGSPQIYKLSLADGKISRQTFTGNYNARASYTPNQSQMVMQHRGDDRQFSIAVQDAATGQLMQLTSSGADESPSVAPNGRLIVYASQKQNQGVLALVSADGRLHSELPSRGGDVQEPAWSPFIH